MLYLPNEIFWGSNGVMYACFVLLCTCFGGSTDIWAVKILSLRVGPCKSHVQLMALHTLTMSWTSQLHRLQCHAVDSHHPGGQHSMDDDWHGQVLMIVISFCDALCPIQQQCLCNTQYDYMNSEVHNKYLPFTQTAMKTPAKTATTSTLPTASIVCMTWTCIYSYTW